MPIAMQGVVVNLLGIDYSYARPDPEQVKAASYSFVMRYLSLEPGKNITPAELQAYHQAGISVGFVWESLADRPLGGAPNGSADGAEAGAQLTALGVPKTVPIFWALDTDPAGAPGWQQACKAYGDAFAQACGYFSFPYGSNAVIDFFGGGWQTQAWSGGVVSQHAFLLQYADVASPIPQVDVNELFNAYALYPPNYTPPATDWLDTVTPDEVGDLIEARVTKVLNTGTAAGQPSWAHTNQAILGQAQANTNTLKAVAGALGILKNMLVALTAKVK